MPFKFKIQNTAAQRKKSSEYTQTHTHTQALTPAHEHTNDLKGSNSGNTVHATLMQFMFITSICVGMCMCRWLQRAANGINSVNSCQWQAESLKRCLYAQNAARACEYFCSVLWRHTYSYMHIHRILYIQFLLFAFSLTL